MRHFGDIKATLYIYARDEAGNRSDEIVFTVILDRAPPVLQSTQPANAAFVNESPSTVVFFFTDLTTSLDEDPTLATVSLSDSSGQEVSGNWELQVPNTVVFTPVYPLDEDTYTASMQAHDLAGNTTSSTISFTYGHPTVTSYSRTRSESDDICSADLVRYERGKCLYLAQRY